MRRDCVERKWERRRETERLGKKERERDRQIGSEVKEGNKIIEMKGDISLELSDKQMGSSKSISF